LLKCVVRTQIFEIAEKLSSQKIGDRKK